MRHKYSWLLLYALVTLLLSLPFYTSCGKEEEVKIGVFFPLTGDVSSWGERGRNATELAVEEINARGGINGRRLKAIYEDSRAEPKTGVGGFPGV